MKPEPLVGHCLQRRRVSPNVGPSYLMIHLVGEECGLGGSLENVVEPCVAEFEQIDLRDWVDFVAGDCVVIPAESVLCPALSTEVIIWPDQQVVLRTRVVFVVLAHVVNRRPRSTEIVTSGDQHWDVDASELSPVRNGILPVGIVARMGNP